MTDSDDNYFSDDLVLDDKTLAVLDQEESKFKRITNTQTQQSVTVAPPAKRQKTTGSWQPQSVSRMLHRADTVEDMEDLPDISIRQDGTYGLQDKQRRPSGPPSRSGPSPGSNVVQAGGSRPATATPSSRGSVPIMRSTSGTGPVRATRAPSRPPSSARGTRITHSPASSQEVPRTQSGPQRVSRVPSAAASGSYVEQLLQQIEELRKKNETMQRDMESAMEAKFSKEGEVTILRKRMEKTAQEHLAQIAKLRSAKDEADAKHVSLQKQYEADKERLKTELTFKRHELETSSRKHSTSLLSKSDVLQTVEPLPSQKQRSSEWSSAGPSRLAPEPPRRPRFGVISDFEKPKKTAATEMRDVPSGFQTGPSRSQVVPGRKEKETASFTAPHGSLVIPFPSPVPQESSGQYAQADFATQMDVGGLVEDFAPHIDVGIDDIPMVDEGIPVMTLSTQENNIVPALPSQNRALHDILLTHTLQGSKLSTLQLLVCASLADTEQIQSYGAALTRIFDTLGGISSRPDRDFDHSARIICSALCEITELVAKNNLILPLTAVLNLLTNLAYVLPSIHTLLLSQHGTGRETLQFLKVLYDIVQDQLQKLDVSIGNEHPDLCSLGQEALSLYEALVWWIPDDLEDSLCACSSMPSLLVTLLHPHRPLWFLVGSLRILIWLSTRQNLALSLLSHPPRQQTRGDGEIADSVDHPHPHHPQIGLACALLIDADRQGPEADELKSCIVTFFGVLSNAHPDAYTLLVESQELLPSIVLYLCRLVAPIWDEHAVVFADPQAAARTIHIINHTTLLLHHLVIGGDAGLDLRERLLFAPAKTYQGLISLFIPTFGRLSYANPPFWLDEKERQRLMRIADPARALLERVIQGPELDLIWETYQDDGDENNDAAMDVDEEEVEAQEIAVS